MQAKKYSTMNLFSIIIPTYNRAHRIRRAIQSVLDQQYISWELIIIDDASTDNTEDVIQPYLSDSRIRYIKNESNQERCVSRNTGIQAANGEYICFLDSDDYHLPHHLESFYNFLKKNDFPKAFLFSNSFNETETGERSDRVCPTFESIDCFTYFLRYTVNPQRWCVHRDILAQESFDPEVTICEDMDTSLRIAAAGFPIHQINERTTVYVAASDSFTHGDTKKWEKELFYLKRIFAKPILKKHLHGKEKRRLLSMCFFHLAQDFFKQGRQYKSLSNNLISVYLYTRGYKSGIWKERLVLIVYNLPLIGGFLRKYLQHKQIITLSIPDHLAEDEKILLAPYHSYAISHPQLQYVQNVLVTPEGLIGKYGVLFSDSAFNLRGRADKNFYLPYARLFLEQAFVSYRGKSLERLHLNGKYLVIHTKWFNYGFWINSCLVRLLMAKEAGLLEDVELIYPQKWDTISYVKESLALFPELKIKRLPEHLFYSCKELFYLPVRQYTGSLDPVHIHLVRTEISKRLELHNITPFRKVYLSRKNRGVRLPENEAELISWLTQEGFEIVEFDFLTFAEQVQLMNETKLFISIHGAGMANINFMQPGTHVIELVNAPYARLEYTFPFWKLGSLNHLSYNLLFCSIHGSNNLLISNKTMDGNEKDFLVNSNIIVPLERLKHLTNEITMSEFDRKH
jgi:glycosyltransferase involved in cell wall biosynthesis